MKKFVSIIILVTLLASFSVMNVFAAAGPASYTIDVRNRTGAPAELNYIGADGVTHWLTVPTGVSSLTLDEGTYNYWVSTKCGNIAGGMNLSQQSEILWITCDRAIPALRLQRTEKVRSASPYVAGTCQAQGGDYGIYYEWQGGTYIEFWSESNWVQFGNGASWDQVWYWMVDPTGWVGNEINGDNDAPGYCGYYDPDIVDGYFTDYWFPPIP